MQLVTIPFSHFCEKARWALDRTELPYRELQFAPVLHRLAVMPLGSATSPVLVDIPRVIGGSNEIVSYCDARLPEADRLLPAEAAERAEVDSLVARFDAVVAPEVRHWIYSWANEDPRRLYDYSVSSLPRAQRPLTRLTLPLISSALKMHFKLDADTHARAAEKVSAEFAFVSDLLADGRNFLVGDRFSAADLAFAAFVGSAVCAPGYGGGWFSPPGHPEDLAAQAHEWEATRAGQWVRRIYAGHRTPAVRGTVLAQA